MMILKQQRSPEGLPQGLWGRSSNLKAQSAGPRARQRRSAH
jgi:hypothetical protein